jgi:FkbM family methyltransferase
MCPQILRTRMSIFYRAYEPEVSALLRAAIRPGETVFDVGAHVGIHALHAAKLVGAAGRVVAFEPWPENAAVLRRHVAHNPALAGQFVAVQASVGAYPGSSTMMEGGGDGQHRLSRADERGSVSAPMVTLDQYVADHPSEPSLILVDVEGEELAVLTGAEGLLRRARPQLVLEHHGPERRAMLMAWLGARGYRVTDLGRRHIHAV